MNKIGLIAGEGKMPVYIAKKAVEKGYEVFVLGLRGNACEKDYQKYAARFKYIRLGQLGTGIEFFNSFTCRHTFLIIFSSFFLFSF